MRKLKTYEVEIDGKWKEFTIPELLKLVPDISEKELRHKIYDTNKRKNRPPTLEELKEKTDFYYPTEINCNGVIKTLSEISKETGINKRTLQSRVLKNRDISYERLIRPPERFFSTISREYRGRFPKMVSDSTREYLQDYVYMDRNNPHYEEYKMSEVRDIWRQCKDDPECLNILSQMLLITKKEALEIDRKMRKGNG